jgi:DTW domain-containing protein YfiP
MVSAIDPRSKARHRRAVIERSRLTLLGFVMPADWRERRALRRMTARGEAFPVIGLPDVWIVTYRERSVWDV